MKPSVEPLAPLPRDPVQALAPYRPERGHGPWDARTAAHLLRRALCGEAPARVARLVNLGAGKAVADLFRPRDPERESLWARLGRSLSQEARGDLAGWWLMKLAQDGRAPGTRLTLFWHDHFACALSKVKSLPALFRQHQLFVEKGEGPFEELVLGVVRDPAMLHFLDCDSNRRGRPNENLSREMMELFTLGVGHYTEKDIKEAARALTGYAARDGRFLFVPENHDPKPKRVLGAEIQNGEDFCRRAVAQRTCPQFLAGKLWRWYVSPDPPAGAIGLLAERWREHGLETKWVVRTLLSSRAFFSAEAHRSLVKSPVDYTVGLTRTLGAKPDFKVLARACDAMGQKLFEPPGVQGWKGGEAWIHATAWIERVNFAARVANGDGSLTRGVEVERLFPDARKDPHAALVELLQVFLQSELSPPRRALLERSLFSEEYAGSPAPSPEVFFPSAAHAVLSLPEYHLA